MKLKRNAGRINGFTLIELIVVIVLLGILSVFGAGLIVGAVKSFFDSSRRAELVDMADNALQRMSREMRSALPNSVRTRTLGTRVAIEFLNTSTGGRYRVRSGSLGSEVLQNCQADVFEMLDGVSGVISPGPAGQANCFNNNADCLVVYNTGLGVGDYNAYNGDNIAAITAVNVGAGTLTCDNGAGWSFPFPLPPSRQQRFFVVDTPISFVCDTASSDLRRYSNYTITPAQPINDADFGFTGDLLADHVMGCQFDYNPGAGARHGLITLRLWIVDVATNESVSLLHQVHVVNVP